MKNWFKILFVVFMYSLFSNLTSAQTADITKACSPIKIKFTAPPGFNSWFWDFKDGVTSILQNPEHVYTDPGSYIVEFKESSGGVVTGSVLITILAKPDVKVQVNPSQGCLPLKVDMLDVTSYANNINVLSKNWVFGDGGFGAGNSISHTYLKEGLFDLSLEIKTDIPGCDVTQIFNDKINVFGIPEVEIITDPDPPTSCSFPFEVKFNQNVIGNQPFNYTWTFGNGNTSTLGIPPNQTYSNAGSYPVKLKVSDKNNCVNADSLVVSVGVAAINVQFPDSVCTDFPFAFDNKSGAGTHKWDFGAGATPATSNIRNPSVSYATKGLKQIHYTLTTGGGKCIKDTIFNIYVFDVDEALPFDYDKDDCKQPIPIQFHYTGPFNSNDAISWEFVNHGTSSLQNPLYIYPVDSFNFSIYGKRQLVVRVKINTKACIAERSLIIPLDILQACFTAEPYKGCAPMTVQFNDCSYSKQTITKWTWVFDDGDVLVTTTPDPPTHIYQNCGNYSPYVIVENSAGCIDTSYAIIIKVCGEACIPEPPMCMCNNSPNPITICHGDTVNFVVLANKFWQDVRILSDKSRLHHCADEREFAWAFDHETGWHDVELYAVSVNGDIYTKTYTNQINVLGSWAKGSFMLVNCTDPKRSFMFSDKSENATSIKWIFPDGQISIQKNVTHVFEPNGYDTILLVAYNDLEGCPPDTAQFIIYTGIINPQITLDKNLCAGEIQLTLNGSPYTSCHDGIKWTFDNDRPPFTTSSSKDFTNFGIPGVYLTTLNSYDENGCLYIDTFSFNINTIKASLNNLPDKICLPYEIQLEASTVSITDPIDKYEWFINGLLVSTDKISSYTIGENFPLDSGRVKIVLKVTTTLGCIDEDFKYIDVYDPVSEIIIGGNLAYCQNEQIVISATDYTAGGSYLDFMWNFGNGTNGTGQMPFLSYKEPGFYAITLNYTEHNTGCTGTTSVSVTIQDKPNAEFDTNVDNEPVLCYPKNVYFNNPNPGGTNLTYNWNFGNGQNSILSDPGTVYNKGNYTATLILQTSAGCADTSSQSFVLVGPEGDFSFDKTAICKGDEITLTLSDTAEVGGWIWDLGDGVVVNGTNPITHKYTNLPPGDTTIVKLVLSDLTGTCTYSVDKILPIVNVIADFELEGGITSVCPGSTIKIINKSKRAGEYLWKFSDGPTTTLESPNVQFTTVGLFTITLYATDTIAGCIDSISKTIEVRELIIDGLVDALICPGDSVLIGLDFPKDSATYLWSPIKDLATPFNFQTLAYPTQNTEYTLNVTQAGGCNAKGTVKVNLIQPYSGATTFTKSVAKGTPVTLDIMLNDTTYIYNWQPSGLLDCANCPTPTYIADTSATFTLSLKDKSGCETYEISYLIKVVPDKIIIPNVFTPNSDAKNDHFQFFIPNGDIEDIGLLKFKVYSRWGELVYDNGDPSKGWDGTHKGKPCPSDVYVYAIEVNFFTGKLENFKGEVTLVR